MRQCLLFGLCLTLASVSPCFLVKLQWNAPNLKHSSSTWSLQSIEEGIPVEGENKASKAASLLPYDNGAIQERLTGITNLLKTAQPSGQPVCTDGKWNDTRCFQALFFMNEKERLTSQIEHALLLLKRPAARNILADLTILFKSMQRNIERLNSANTSYEVPQEDGYTGAAHKMAVIKELMKSVVDLHLENLPHKTTGFPGSITPL